MAIPAKATGYGNNSTAKNVFRLEFSTALSAAPKYELYDGATFPATGSATTTSNEIFAGTAGNSNKPMMSLADTNSAPASNWKPASATAGGAVLINRMKGQTNFVTAGNTPGAGGAITWNMVLEVPSDATPGSAGQAHDLLVRYSYTGTAPTLAWKFNEGTEGTPSWTVMTKDTHGIRHCRTGSGAGNYLANIPTSSTEDTTEGWVTV